MIEQMDGRSMRTFVAVLEERSLSKAAARLGYVQSTITAQIQQMEQLMGVRLFQRLPRGVEPTEAGKAIAPFAYRFLQLGQSLQDQLSGLDEPKGPVRMRALESFCVPHLPQLLPAFIRQYPQIELHFETGFQHDIVEEVNAYRIDLGIVPSDPQLPQMEFIPLFSDELVWVAASELACGMQDGEWGNLPQVKVISYGGRCIYHHIVERELQKKGVIHFSVMEFDSLEMIKQTVICGMGAALLPFSSVQAEIASGRLTRVKTDTSIPINHGLICMKDRELSTAARIWKDRLLDWFQT
ncbi:LysR family transcriptional regulator [Paenibacillus hexagrammi]|uniref:LysR family transcriptional regulator n=1 Tax=Paenibacillus hexagrammi TaxID=2908839 RepID=A0ABY3SEY4_9BACL|nr:LysR family transcriptional regulator [Paenibacillus sp. YPD9-1]UJF32554.1 LysR family transcriptional regulator [Paenibacillus sp. YPD9-1]